MYAQSIQNVNSQVTFCFQSTNASTDASNDESTDAFTDPSTDTSPLNPLMNLFVM